MSNHKDKYDEKLPVALIKRDRELDCFYEVSNLFNDYELTIDQLIRKLIEVIPNGFEHPDLCKVKIDIKDESWCSPDFVESSFKRSIALNIHDETLGKITIAYLDTSSSFTDTYLFAEEEKLINLISRRLSNNLQIRRILDEIETGAIPANIENGLSSKGWRIGLDFIQKYNQNLYHKIVYKMMVNLCLRGVIDEAELLRFGQKYHETSGLIQEPVNQIKSGLSGSEEKIYEKAFDLVAQHLKDEEILASIHQWMRDAKHGLFIRNLIHPDCSMQEIVEAVRYFHNLSHQDIELPRLLLENAIVRMIRFLFSEQMDFIRIAKKHINIHDFHRLISHTIYLPDSHGRMGNKASDLFLASCILSGSTKEAYTTPKVEYPKTWHITSNGLYDCLSHNGMLDELSEHKYKDIQQIRLEYPFIKRLFRDSWVPPWMESTLRTALEEFEDTPIIIRSSSLLSQMVGIKYLEQYRSKILANQGSKQDRYKALLDAVLDVYASTFAPEPIKYRAEHGLLDFNEEMAVIIQKVVGKRAGKYFFPLLSGSAFIESKLRRATDSTQDRAIIKLVPGLCLEDIDEIPGAFQASFEVVYSDLACKGIKKDVVKCKLNTIQVINLETNQVESIEIQQLLDNCTNMDSEYKILSSILSSDIREKLNIGKNSSTSATENIPNDENQQNPDHINQIISVLGALKEVFNSPLEITYAFDCDKFYLLRCSYR
ncbi:MAG: PEP/pyruvate-binding domain-containing protein [Candidatus Electryonea clarkiae]|nr:PEP/pyruvate-binding domain-containing protein [Candidatus Electryonea clarkiae]